MVTQLIAAPITIQDIGQAIASEITIGKVLIALGSSVIVTAIAFSLLVWAENRQSQAK